MKQFEYKIVTRDGRESEAEQDFLNRLGKLGWELISIKSYLHMWYYFKREKLWEQEKQE